MFVCACLPEGKIDTALSLHELPALGIPRHSLLEVDTEMGWILLHPGQKKRSGNNTADTDAARSANAEHEGRAIEYALEPRNNNHLQVLTEGQQATVRHLPENRSAWYAQSL